MGRGIPERIFLKAPCPFPGACERWGISILNTFAVLLSDNGWQLVDPLGPSPFDEQPVDDIIARVKEVHKLNRR